MGVFWNDQGINDDPVIKVDFKSKFPYIIGYIFELLRPYFHGLDSPGLARDN